MTPEVVKVRFVKLGKGKVEKKKNNKIIRSQIKKQQALEGPLKLHNAKYRFNEFFNS